MLFTHDTEIALAEAAALVNTLSDGVDELDDDAGLDALPGAVPVLRRSIGARAEELAQVRQLRGPAATCGPAADRDEAAAIVNAILAEADAQPYLSKHDEWDWHLHVTRPDAPLAQRIGAEAAMGFLDLIRAGRLGRLRICARRRLPGCAGRPVPEPPSVTATPATAATGPTSPPTAPASGQRVTDREAQALAASQRAAVPPFAVMSILNRVAELRAAGREVISLCAGEPSQGAPSDVRRRAAELMVGPDAAGLQRDLRHPAAAQRDRRALPALVRPGGRPRIRSR